MILDENNEGILHYYGAFLACICLLFSAQGVPANGVAGLQPAFQINHLLEVVEKHKKTAADPSASANVEKRLQQALLHTTRSRLFVSEHSGKEAELYCETCGELIRWKCVLKCGKHHGHDYEELDKAFERYKIEITASLHGANGEATDHHQ